MTAVARRAAGLVQIVVRAAVCGSLSASFARAQGPAQQRSFWFLATTAEQGWDSNPTFATGGVADNISRLNAALSVFKRLPVGTVSVVANGGGIKYGKNDQLSNYFYGALVSTDKRFTANFTGTAQVGYDTRLTADLTGGLNLPLLRLATQHVVTGALRASERFTAQTSGIFSLNYSAAKFDSPELIPGSTLNGQALFSHRYSPFGALISEIDVMQGTAQGIPTALQTVQVGWEPRVGRTATFRILAGATRGSAGSASKVIPSGTATLADSVGIGRLSVNYGYQATPAFGLGGVITNSAVSASYDLQARRGNFVTISGVSAVSKQTVGGGTPIRTEILIATLRRVFRSGLTMTLGSSYRARHDVAEATGYNAQLGFGYTFGSH